MVREMLRQVFFWFWSELAVVENTVISCITQIMQLNGLVQYSANSHFGENELHSSMQYYPLICKLLKYDITDV